MYEEFFRMTDTPFTRGIPENSLYTDNEISETENRLIYIAQKQLFGILSADAGMGKTTLLRRFCKKLHSTEYTVLYLSDSKLTPRHFYNGLLEQLGCETRFYRGDARKLLHRQIEIMRGVGHRKLVVIVDEAHLLSQEMFEEIRFLLNYHMDSENPLALILSGQSEMNDKLKLQSMRAVQNRIDVKCYLNPFDFSRTKAYIAKQLAYSGHEGDIFSEEAQHVIHKFSGGIPRLINRACSQSLIYAYQSRRNIVDDHMVEEVLRSEV